jgi:hypothetical protein
VQTRLARTPPPLLHHPRPSRPRAAPAHLNGALLPGLAAVQGLKQSLACAQDVAFGGGGWPGCGWVGRGWSCRRLCSRRADKRCLRAAKNVCKPAATCKASLSGACHFLLQQPGPTCRRDVCAHTGALASASPVGLGRPTVVGVVARKANVQEHHPRVKRQVNLHAANERGRLNRRRRAPALARALARVWW